jgi:hypothetical protein
MPRLTPPPHTVPGGSTSSTCHGCNIICPCLYCTFPPPPQHPPVPEWESVSRTCPVVVVTPEAHGPCPLTHNIRGGGGGCGPVRPTLGHTPFVGHCSVRSRDRWWERRPVLAAAGREETFVADFDASGPFLPGSGQESRTEAEGGGGRSRLAVRVRWGGGGRRPTRVRKLGDLSRITPSGTCRGTLSHAVYLGGGLYRERSSCLLSGHTIRYGSGRGGGEAIPYTIAHANNRILYGTGVRFHENYFFKANR